MRGCWCTGKGFKRTYSSEASAKAKSTQQVDAASLAKARKLSVPVGVLAGIFGSFVGVGGGVLIVPMLTGACKALPQRLLTTLFRECIIFCASTRLYRNMSSVFSMQKHTALASGHTLC